ncbi:MAG: phage terminase large subunit [Neisseria sp.]|nr:phage terminase large subunit [Neisseria sp.]
MVSNREKFALLRERRLRDARRDFLSFRKLINPKHKWGWWQEEVAAVLQQFYEDLIGGKRPKLVIQAPPQHGKSVQIIDFIAWLAGKNPDCRTIYTSFSERLGIRANLRLQRLYDSEIYREIFPATVIGKSKATPDAGQYLRNREILEYVGHDGFFRNTTVRGSITGESLDLGVIDDPIRGRADANSETIRNAAWDWFTDDFFTRFSEDAGLLAILTRWHIDDPIGRMIERVEGVTVKSYAAIAEEDEAHRKRGEALFPEHKSLEFLQERKQAMPQGNWLALYQQRPTAQEGNLFKPERLVPIDALPALPVRWLRGWDFASSDGKGDYTAGALIGALQDGRFVIAGMVHGQYGTDDRDAVLRNTAAGDGHLVRISIPQDPGQAGKSQVLYLTRQLAGFSVSASPESGDKATRAEPFAAQVNAGNVLILGVNAAWHTALKDEMRLFPNGKYDDQIDACSRAFNALMSGTTGMIDFMRHQIEQET